MSLVDDVKKRLVPSLKTGAMIAGGQLAARIAQQVIVRVDFLRDQAQRGPNVRAAMVGLGGAAISVGFANYAFKGAMKTKAMDLMVTGALLSAAQPVVDQQLTSITDTIVGLLPGGSPAMTPPASQRTFSAPDNVLQMPAAVGGGGRAYQPPAVARMPGR